MQEKYQYEDSTFFDDHRLEIENRMRNLFWTINGDYRTEIKPDLELFRESPNAAIYEAVRQGAFSRYFQMEEVALYIWKKIHFSADQKRLLSLVRLCADAAVFPKLSLERKGIQDMRADAASDLQAEKEELLETIVSGELKESFVREIEKFSKITDTATFIRELDRIYNQYLDPEHEEKNGNLASILNLPIMEMADDAAKECMTDEQMEDIIQKYLADLKKDMLRIRRKKRTSSYQPGQRKNTEDVDERIDPEAAKKVKDYVALNYGESYLKPLELIQMQQKHCRGMHLGCSLHFTDGILHKPVLKNNQYRFSQLQFEKNRLHYYNNHWIVKRNITELADILGKALVQRAEEHSERAITGQIVPGRLWKVGRTKDEKLFDRKNPAKNQEFVLDILLDSSGSQAKRQSQVALQGYIISEALSRVNIPHRVVSFCSFWDYTILHRFRDYEDGNDKNMRILEFRATGNNRDGLAIKVTTSTLMERQEENKILIILSDGKPCDVSAKRPGTKAVAAYQGEDAVKDTAFVVRKARSEGITVLGIFSGNEEDLASEKKIYGKDFAFIRDIRNFSKIVGTYLKKQIDIE